MRIAIVGSGHAAVGALVALRERGLKPEILDVGETLDPALRARADNLAATEPNTWSRDQDPFPTIKMSGGKTPPKLLFGSDFIFARDRALAPIRSHGTTAAPSWAKGGFSLAWGGAMLPPTDRDLTDWPVSAGELQPHLQATDKILPITGGPSRLDAAFGFDPRLDEVAPLDPLARSLLAALDRAFPPDRAPGHISAVAYGPARLALDLSACRSCGMCLVGCPYGAIATNDRTIDLAHRRGEARYRSGLFVTAIDEDADGVTIRYHCLEEGGLKEEHYDFVFLAAGALGTARIVLASQAWWDRSIEMRDSLKFAVPLLFLSGATARWPDKPTLADIFLETVFPNISEHWLHIQLSTVNEIVLDQLRARKGRQLTTMGRLLWPVLGRMLVAWCGAHSDLSAGARIRLSRAADKPAGILEVNAQDAERSAMTARRYAYALARSAPRFRALVAPMVRLMSDPCSTGHSGGQFPMRRRPIEQYETDLLGRLRPWRRTFIADASCFPSVPGATIAPLIRANAHRIASNAPLELG